MLNIKKKKGDIYYSEYKFDISIKKYEDAFILVNKIYPKNKNIKNYIKHILNKKEVVYKTGLSYFKNKFQSYCDWIDYYNIKNNETKAEITLEKLRIYILKSKFFNSIILKQFNERAKILNVTKIFIVKGLIPYRKGDKWGYCNQNKKIIIPIEYDFAGSFNEGLAAVQLNDKYGFINKKGRIVVPIKYGLVRNFNEGLAAVKIDDKWGFINKKGRIVVPIKYDDAWSFKEGLAGVKIDDKQGFINKKGRIDIPIKYDDARNFKEGLAAVCFFSDIYDYGQCNFINKKGKIIGDRCENAIVLNLT